jgi:hypothetical protein
MSAFVHAVHARIRARLRTTNAELAEAVNVANDKNAALLTWLHFAASKNFSIDPVLESWVLDHLAIIPNIPWVDDHVADVARYILIC